jgi:hypothetical protein
MTRGYPGPGKEAPDQLAQVTGSYRNPVTRRKSLLVLEVLKAAIHVRPDIGCHQPNLKLAASILIW